MEINITESVRRTCRQCRARKVRCDRAGQRCGPCTRLHLDCSLGDGRPRLETNTHDNHSSTNNHTTFNRPNDTTEAGLKRRRTKIACQQCRLVKVKCSGNDPCMRCSRRGLQCELMMNGSPSSVPDVAASPDSAPKFQHILLLEKGVVRKYIEAYFEKTSSSVCVFLHKPSVLASWSCGNIDQALLAALCASGLRLCTDISNHNSLARTWIQGVQKTIMSRMNTQSLVHLQTLVLIIHFHVATGQHLDAWNLIALAARLAFTLRLNYENNALDSLAQEIRRRLVWAIYQLDHKFAGGNDDLAMCPSSKIHLRLPCDRHTFLRGIESRSGYLSKCGNRGNEGIDVLGYHIILGSIHYKILTYTKKVRRSNESPVNTKTELQALDYELQYFKNMLPTDLQLDTYRLLLIINMEDSNAIVLLHNLWIQCVCDLHRFLIPGLREAVSPGIIAETPVDYVEYCQQVCLQNAIRLCKFWSQLYHLNFRPTIDNLLLFISIYQVTQIIHHLSNLLPEHGEECLNTLKENLCEAILLTEGIQDPPALAMRCREDAQKVMGVLGTGIRAAIDGEKENCHHLPSHHSLIPKDMSTESGSSNTEEKETTNNSPASMASQHKYLPVGRFPQAPDVDWQEELPPIVTDADDIASWNLFDTHWSHHDNANFFL